MRFSVRTGSYFGMWTAVLMQLLRLAKAEDNLSTDNEIIESPVYIVSRNISNKTCMFCCSNLSNH